MRCKKNSITIAYTISPRSLRSLFLLLLNPMHFLCPNLISSPPRSPYLQHLCKLTPLPDSWSIFIKSKRNWNHSNCCESKYTRSPLRPQRPIHTTINIHPNSQTPPERGAKKLTKVQRKGFTIEQQGVIGFLLRRP